MANIAVNATVVDGSDYGSDFTPEEDEILQRLASGQPVAIAEIEDNPIVNSVEYHEPSQTLRVPRVFGREERSPLYQAARAAEQVAEQISNSVKSDSYPRLGSLNKEHSPSIDVSIPEPPPGPEVPDTRSPLLRFRTAPKKALSVTDLVSPAWCELQYWYTLTIHGKKRRTAAMKQGSVVHQQLEDQVHKTVKVDIETKEDAWGLRIWNVIQGLRTLRETGQTRELEIWGTIDGLVVNGIIDELSYDCPDSKLEESMHQFNDDAAPDQTTLEEYFKTSGASTLSKSIKSKRPNRTDMVYLCDVKTRAARSLPAESAFRPTKMQLMLYHDLLASLATNNVDFSVLTSRYNLDPSRVFSDAFLAQIGNLNDEVFYDALTTPDSSQTSFTDWSQDSMTTLLAHNCISLLWTLMISEFQITFPQGAASLGRILKAEYRSRDTGAVIGSKSFAMDDKILKSYVDREIQWWKGERQPQGVAVDEAFKCRSCDFAEGCEWRLKKVEEATEKIRMSKKRTSAV